MAASAECRLIASGQKRHEQDRGADSISDVRGRHQGTCDLANPSTPAATVTAVRSSPDGIHYLARSDSTIAADPADARPPVIITDTSPAASTTPGAALTARTGTIPRAGLRGVALLSDGATRITDRYGLLSWPDILATIHDQGPAELIRQVRVAVLKAIVRPTFLVYDALQALHR